MDNLFSNTPPAKRRCRENETPEQKRSRLEKDKESKRLKRANETPEQRRTRLDKDNERQKQRKSNELSAEKQIRLERENNIRKVLRDNETANEKRVRLDADLAGKKTKQQNKSDVFRTTAENAESNEELILEHYLGKLDVVCKHCNSLNFSEEKTGSTENEFTRCCHKGQVKLDSLQPYPKYLHDLLTDKLPESKNFKSCIRSYNSSFAGASTGANVKPPAGNGPYCFRVCGQIVHRAGTLHPEENEQRKFSQLYILDPDDAAVQRMLLPENKDCNEYLMRTIGEIMENNPWVRLYKQLHEVEKEANATAEMQGIAPTKVMLAILQDAKNDPRRYNAPIINEVAVVFQSEDGEPPFERDIIIHLRPDPNKPHEKFKRINILNPNLDALTYPILFPNGEKGWHPQIQRIKKNEDRARERVTMREYFSYRLSVRALFCPLLSSGKLFQQLAVDWYVRAEANDLKWIKENQPKLRSEKYNGLMDYINRDAETNNFKIGKAVILPSSFQGSPRNLQQHFQDAMAIVTKYGKPDLFITMTCNPKWKEIVENLEPWQQAEHRPDLVARVFNLKLKNLINDICAEDKSVFGKVIAKIYVIEFQKRGLPHAHILIILDKENKIKTEEDVDCIVKAELPDKIKSPRLFEIVTRNMIHTPCGKHGNTKSPCLVNNKCSKGFPKDISNSTINNVDGYPKYKRQEIQPIMINGRSVDNRWIVPYNPFLTLKYNCHINVEVCASIKSVKYLFKYVYKGHDCANLCVNESNDKDESKDYVDSRYVSAPEAIWRIFCMKMHDQSHTVVRLPVHLEDQQMVAFREGNEDIAAERASGRLTKLTAWFNLNMDDTTARQYRYWDIPKHYVWNDKLTMWKERQRGADKVIGRMYSVSLKDQERYYLRILLTHERGVTSYEDIKTVEKDGIKFVCDTFQEAAKEKGYVLTESVWQETIDEAKVFQMPSQLRQLFAYICALGNVTEPVKLWNENKNDMMEDICRRIHEGMGECRNCEYYALIEIRDTLIILNKVYSEYGLPIIPTSLRRYTDVVYNLAEEFTKANEMIQTLNPEQRFAFDQILENVNDMSLKPKCFFLDGPGGSGKTYLYTTLLHYFRGRNEIVLPAASTGIAANLLIGGRTFHSLYKLPIPIVETSVSNIKPDSKDAQTIREAKLMIIDECTMASSHAINTIDNLLKDLMDDRTENEKRLDEDWISFGGKVLLLGGDFRQCLSIVPHAKQSAIVEQSLKYSQAWKNITKLSLITNMRSEDPLYSSWLLKLGEGSLTNTFNLPDDMIEIPKEFLCEGSLVNEIFGDKISVDNIPSISKRAILCPKNSDVDLINEEIIALIEGEAQTYLSDDQVVADDEDEISNFPIEFLNTVRLSGWPPHKLTLKKGTIIMLLRNFNTKRGLCNGTRLVVRDLNDNVIKADVLTEAGFGQTVLIPRIDFCSNEADLPFKMRRRQFPVKPAFAMTINKSQGQTLEKVGIYLADPVFGHGQLYVAFSRVRKACDVKVKIIETSEQGKLIEGCEVVFTRNVVYKEIFTLRENMITER